MSARVSVLPVFVPHLGCHHACVFCNQRRISGQMKPATASDVEQILKQSAAFPRHGEKRQLAFYGGSFTAIPVDLQNALLAPAHAAVLRGEIDSVRLSTRPDAIDPDILTRLRSFGVDTVELGAQSMDEEVLRLSGRGHTAEDVRRASRLVKEAGLELILQMMTGLPGDSPEKSLYTAKELIALRPDGVRVYPTVIVRDTELFDLWMAGEYREHTVEDAVALCARLLPLFEEARIPVIRLGLNPTEELSSGEAVAGAYHPALGELVKSRMLLHRAEEALQGIPPGSHVRIGIAPRLLSQMIGQHGENRRKLIGTFSLASLRFVPVEDCILPRLLFQDKQLHPPGGQIPQESV